MFLAFSVFTLCLFLHAHAHALYQQTHQYSAFLPLWVYLLTHPFSITIPFAFPTIYLIPLPHLLWLFPDRALLTSLHYTSPGNHSSHWTQSSSCHRFKHCTDLEIRRLSVIEPVGQLSNGEDSYGTMHAQRLFLTPRVVAVPDCSHFLCWNLATTDGWRTSAQTHKTDTYIAEQYSGEVQCTHRPAMHV